MSDPIGVPTFADVQREKEAAAEFGVWTQHFTDGPVVFQFDTSAMVKEITKLRAEVARLRAPSDAVCDAIIDGINRVGLFRLPALRYRHRLRAAIRAALAQGEA